MRLSKENTRDLSAKKGVENDPFIPGSPSALEAEIKTLNSQIHQLKNDIQYLREQNEWFRRHVFGRKSERLVDTACHQTLYLPGFEPKTEEDNDSDETEEVPAHTRKKRKSKNDYNNGLLIPEDLPEEKIVLDVDESEKVCPETGEPLECIGEEVTRRLAVRPAEYFIKTYVRPKYAHPSKEEAGIICKEAPDSILPRCRADESLLAEIIVNKFADHLPLYRLSEIFSRNGVQITRQLISQWIIRTGQALKPLYNLLLKETLESKVIFIDETPVKLQVQGKEKGKPKVKGKGKLKTGYMWTVVGGLGPNPPNRVYKFFDSRKYENAYSLLDGFTGLYHSDKFGAYEQISKKAGCIWQACWAHIRRKFEEVTSGDPEFRKFMLRKIRYLFMFERVAWNHDEEKRLWIRKEKEEPIIDELIATAKKKMEEGKILPKSKLGKALYYFLGLADHIKAYITNPDARLDNNPAERANRPLAIGRKNWLFIGSMQSGESTSVLLSLVQTCRAQGINPREYLEDVMRRFQSHSINKLHELLPCQWAKAREKNKPKMKPIHQR